MEDSLSLTSPNPNTVLNNVKINDTDFCFKGLNKTPLPGVCICISSETSQEDTIFANEDMSDLYNGKYFHSVDILSSFRCHLS